MRWYCTYQTHNEHKLRVAVESQQYPDGTNIFRLRDTEACMICTTEPPTTAKFEITPNNRTWTDHFDSPDTPIEQLAHSLVLNDNSSVFLQGFGGTGRTYCAKRIAVELSNRGNKVICTSYTHMATQHIAVPGCINGTLHHCMHKTAYFVDKPS